MRLSVYNLQENNMKKLFISLLLLGCFTPSTESFAAKKKCKEEHYIDRYLCDEPYPAAVVAYNVCKTSQINSNIFWADCDKTTIKIITHDDESGWIYPAKGTKGYSIMADICNHQCSEGE
jgi:hypothetical protein